MTRKKIAAQNLRLGSTGKTNSLTVPGAEPVSLTGVVLRLSGVSFLVLKRHGHKIDLDSNTLSPCFGMGRLNAAYIAVWRDIPHMLDSDHNGMSEGNDGRAGDRIPVDRGAGLG